MLHYAAIIIAAAALLGLVGLTRLLMRRHPPRQRPLACVSPPPAAAPDRDPEPARAALLKHFSLFAPIIGQIARRRMSRCDWAAAIASTGNEELASYLRRYGTDTRPWMRLLRMWGIQPEDSAALWGRDERAALYADRRGNPLHPEKRYRVLSPAWTLTCRPGAHTSVTLLCPGTAAEIGE